MNSITLKKIFIIIFILTLNIAVTVLIYLYGNSIWYLPIIGMSNLNKVILILLNISYQVFRLIRCSVKRTPDKFKNVGFVIPSYTEDEELLRGTLDTLTMSIDHCINKYAIRPILFLIVDGKSKGKNSDFPTYQIWKKILNPNNLLTFQYEPWKKNICEIDFSYGFWKDIPYVLLTKEKNQTKKDSLIIVREFTDYLNSGKHIMKNYVLNNALIQVVNKEFGISNIEFLFGTDAGTKIGIDTVTSLLENIEKNEKVVGVSGFVKVDTENPSTKYNWLVLYQAFEYIIQQAITRRGQSIVKHVTCLPGCVQLFRMNQQTLGIALEKFENLPSNDSGVLKMIKAHLGEDRRYSCLIQYESSDAEMTLDTNALAYTDVPNTWSVFLSQRRRWFLSSNANNIKDMISTSLPFLIRFVAFAQLWSSMFIIAEMVCFVRCILVIINGIDLYSALTLFSIYMFITIYKIIIAIKYAESFSNFFYLIASLILYIIISSGINLAIMFHALWTMDNYSWGLTQQVKQDSAPVIVSSIITPSHTPSVANTTCTSTEGVIIDEPNCSPRLQIPID